MYVISLKYFYKFLVVVFTIAFLLLTQTTAFAAVAHDIASESHTGNTGSTNESSFSWTHTPSGTPRGVLVFVHTVNEFDIISGVTYGGVAMTVVSGGTAVDTRGEEGRIETYFLGSSIPTGPQTITVNRTNNNDEVYASAITQTAAKDTEVYTPGIILLEGNGSWAVQSVTDGSAGSDSVRYASGYSGRSDPLSAGTGSTVLNSIDYGRQTSTTVRETTAGQGARDVGFSQGGNDDRAGVHLAIREIPASATLSASPSSCTILAEASTCDIAFTWNISNATSPILYNTTTTNQYSTSASGSSVSYPITNGLNTIQARDSITTLASINTTGSCASETSWDGASCAPTTLPTFTITSTAGVNGSISPLGTINVTQASSQTYTITPDTGYSIASLTIDGSSIATSTTYTFDNVQANHTIDTTFLQETSPPTSTGGSGGASRPTTITFSGKAFPGGVISITEKFLSTEEKTEKNVISEEDGSFRISFVGILQGLQSFALLAKDKNGLISQTKYFLFNTTSEDFVEKEILLPPTIDILSGQISRGKNATFYGYASPAHSVKLYIDDILQKESLVDSDGSYSIEIPTGALTFGQHSATIKQVDQKTESDFSTARTFLVSQLNVVKADLSGDGKITIQDWSIFLSRWVSKNPDIKNSIDLTGDGVVDISDFSIFIKTIKQ